jgi:hypothetical protein
MDQGDVAVGKAIAAALGAWLVFEDEAAVSMTSHRSRTWAPRGPTPTVRFNGGSRGRITLAALACYKPGERSRLIYRPRIQGHLRGDHRGFTWQDYRNLIVRRAHLQLGDPVVVIWDNCETHGAPSGARGLTRGTTGLAALLRICRPVAQGGACCRRTGERVPIGALPHKAPSQF